MRGCSQRGCVEGGLGRGGWSKRAGGFGQKGANFGGRDQIKFEFAQGGADWLKASLFLRQRPNKN